MYIHLQNALLCTTTRTKTATIIDSNKKENKINQLLLIFFFWFITCNERTLYKVQVGGAVNSIIIFRFSKNLYSKQNDYTYIIIITLQSELWPSFSRLFMHK